MAHETQVPPRFDSGPSAARTREPGHGWTVFAGTMFLIASAANTLYGIAALAKDDLFAADELLFADLAVWGVASLLFGVVQLIVGWLILRRSALGAVTGIMVAALNATLALCSIGAYPRWSAVVLVIDGLIIYALSVYAGDWT